jgi:hypothetical protein
MDFRAIYKRNDYINFFRTYLLPEDFDDQSEDVSLGFKPQHISKVIKIGEVPSLELNIYEVTHPAENDPRVSLSRDAFRLLAQYGVKRALIVFNSETSSNFRLSLVTIDLKWEEGKRVQKEYSNPRRYSFFLGPETKTHTPEEYLIKQARVKDFDDLKNRFSIEVVNKDFYTQIAVLFTQMAGGKRTIGRKSIDAGRGLLNLPSTVDDTLDKEFTVRLLGRLVFCWFLKKKRSDKNIPLLPEELLSSKAVAENKGYYHSILEPLFFEILNERVDKRQKKYQEIPWSQIPFLNGGLFTPHHHDYYELGPLGISKYINTLKVPDHWIKELFEVFETYNFTIDENTSVDVELSIEPEMLGRIFENLLAEINPETGETARKATGSYYTPRPIVEYMVDESLKQYLMTKTKLDDKKIKSLLTYEDVEIILSDTDRDLIVSALDTLKIIDPACGSGAFPMGVLQKLLLILQKVDPESQYWLDKKLSNIPDASLRRDLKTKLKADNFNYIHKLGIIRDAIYGIDIQPIAVEISKLRFFLSLIVDEKVNDAKENRGIEPLPNLEFKFVCANSLIELPKKNDQKTLFEADNDITLLKNLRDEYLRSYGSEKKRVEKKFSEVQSKMAKHALSWALWGGERSQTMKLSQWDPFSEEPCGWFDSEWMFGIKNGFDIVIGNPPYIFSRENLTAEDKEIYKRIYTLTQFKINLYILFIEKAFRTLNDSGTLVYIIPNNWLTLATNSDLRRFLLSNTYDVRVVFNYDRVFENASVDTCILIFNRQGAQKISGYQWKEGGIEQVKSCESNKYLKTDNCILGDLMSETNDGFRICEKINSIAECLSVSADVKNGVQAYTVGEGEPIQTEEMKKNRVYHSDHPRDKSWIKYLDGIDVMRYRLGWSGEFIKYGENLSRSRMPSLFQGERLIVRQIPGQPPYCIHSCYTNKPFINDNNSMIIKMKNGKISPTFILGLINSKLISFWFVHTFGKLQRKIFPQFKVKELMIFPIIGSEPKKQSQIVDLVDRILVATAGADYLNNPDKQKEVSLCNEKIDQIVYALYGLSKEEIELVEKLKTEK